MTCDYLSSCLKDILNWKGFPEDQNIVIFSNGYEVDYLFNLKNEIYYFHNHRSPSFRPGKFEDMDNDMSYHYLEISYPEKSFEEIYNMKLGMFPKLYKDALEVSRFKRFSISRLRTDFLEMPDTVSRLTYLNDQLYDYRQMCLEPRKRSVMREARTLTKNFEKECQLEIERLHKKLELELKAAAIKTTEIPESVTEKPLPSALTWKANDTDLLELVAALHKENIIVRKDKKPMSRKELIDFFSQLFDLQINNVEVKLARATNRNEKTPFLDRLRAAFENYAEEKDEKQRKRK